MNDVTLEPSAIIYSTLSTGAIMSLIRPNYPVSEDTRCVLYQRGVSDIYLLSSRDRQFALKVYRTNWRTRTALEQELAALQHLSKKGIRVVEAVPRHDAEFVTDIPAPEGTRRAVLFNWVTGNAPKYADSDHAFQYGTLLGGLHTAGDDLSPTNARPEMNAECLFDAPLSQIRPLLISRPESAKRLEVLAERLGARLSRARGTLHDWGFCHGDVWSDNARINGGCLVLLDFDFCGFGWRLFDLATYRWQARRQGVEMSAWAPFIRGYSEARSPVDSLEFIGLFMVLRELWHTAHWIRLSEEFGISHLTDHYFEEVLEFCETLAADSGV